MSLMIKSTKLITLAAGVLLADHTLLGQHFTLDLSLGDPIYLQPNMANQEVPIYIVNDSSPGQVTHSMGLNASFSVVNPLNLQVPGPTIIAGLHFNGGAPTSPYYVSGLNNPTSINQTPSDPGPYTTIGTLDYRIGSPAHTDYWLYTLGLSTPSTSADFPLGPSKLLTLVFDTSGVGAGTWTLKPSVYSKDLAGDVYTEVIDGASAYSTSFVNATLIIVPEPAVGAVVLGVGLLGFMIYRRSRS